MAAVAATLRVVIYIDTGGYEDMPSVESNSEYTLFMESIEALRRKEALAHRPWVLFVVLKTGYKSRNQTKFIM